MKATDGDEPAPVAGATPSSSATSPVVIQRSLVERLARVLLDGRRTLTGDEIVAAIVTSEPPLGEA